MRDFFRNIVDKFKEKPWIMAIIAAVGVLGGYLLMSRDSKPSTGGRVVPAPQSPEPPSMPGGGGGNADAGIVTAIGQMGKEVTETVTQGLTQVAAQQQEGLEAISSQQAELFSSMQESNQAMFSELNENLTSNFGDMLSSIQEGQESLVDNLSEGQRDLGDILSDMISRNQDSRIEYRYIETNSGGSGSSKKSGESVDDIMKRQKKRYDRHKDDNSTWAKVWKSRVAKETEKATGVKIKTGIDKKYSDTKDKVWVSGPGGSKDTMHKESRSSVEKRQKIRYDRAMKRGDTEAANRVKRETTNALGRSVNW